MRLNLNARIVVIVGVPFVAILMMAIVLWIVKQLQRRFGWSALSIVIWLDFTRPL